MKTEMGTFSQNKQNAINFVSHVSEFQKNFSLIDVFLGNIGVSQAQGIKHFLAETQLLFMEQTLDGSYSCKTGITFEQMNSTDVHSLVEDIEMGKYDNYF